MIQAGKENHIKQGKELQELMRRFMAAEAASLKSQAELESEVAVSRKRLEDSQIDLVRGASFAGCV